MAIAHKCDISGQYADSMDRVKSYEWNVTKSGHEVNIRLSLDVTDMTGKQLELAPSVWAIIIDEVKARIV